MSYNNEDRRALSKIAGWVGFLVAALIARAGVSYAKEFFRSPYEKATAQAMRETGGQERFNAWAARFTSDAAAHDSGAALAARGIARLGPEDLLIRARLMPILYDRMGVDACGSVTKGQPTPVSAARMQDAITSLTGDTLRQWVGMSMRAMLAEIDQTHRAPVDSALMLDAIQHIGQTLTSVDSARYWKTLADISTASNEDACWTAQTLYGGSARLSAPEAENFLRGIAK